MTVSTPRNMRLHVSPASTRFPVTLFSFVIISTGIFMIVCLVCFSLMTQEGEIGMKSSWPGDSRGRGLCLPLYFEQDTKEAKVTRAYVWRIGYVGQSWKMTFLKFRDNFDPLWHTKLSRCAQKVKYSIRRRKFRFVLSNLENCHLENINVYICCPLVENEERSVSAWWRIPRSWFALHWLPVASSGWPLLAIVQTFWSMDKNIETKTRCPLRFRQNDMLRIFVKFTTSAFML
jgi:hypothetical protein